MKRKTDNILLIDCLKTKYGIIATILKVLPLGADMNASVYKAETCNGQSYFVKLKRGHQSDISVTLLGLLQASGIQQIIPPIKTRDGKQTQHINDFTLTVYPFVNGQNGFCYPLTDNQWVALGKALKQVHDLNLPPSIKERIRKESYSSQWREAIRTLYSHIDEDLDVDETALKLQAFMREHKAVIHRLVEKDPGTIARIRAVPFRHSWWQRIDR